MPVRFASTPLRAHVWCVLLFLCAILPAASASGRDVIPLVANADGYFVTPVRLNGAPGSTAIIDTAATFAMISARMARSVAIAPPDAGASKLNVLGLLGAREYPVVAIAGIELGDMRFSQVPAAYNNRERMPGSETVIPATAFTGDVLDFDFPRGEFTAYFGRPKTRGTRAPVRAPLVEENGLFFTEVNFNGTTAKALVDTGSPISLVNTSLAAAAGISLNVEKSQILNGATGGMLPAHVATARRFSVGRQSYRRIDILVADPALFESLGLHNEPVMLMGLDMLSSFRVQIDRSRQTLILTQADAGNSVMMKFNARDSRIPQ